MLSNNSKNIVFTIALSMCSMPAFANHGLDGLGKAVEIMFIIAIVVLAITVIAFVIAGRNVSRKNKSMRTVSTLMSLPMLLLTLASFTIHPLPGLISGMILAILWALIYKSFEPYKEKVTSEDME